MAAEKMFLIEDGPSLMEMQFSDYFPGGHTVFFTVEQTDGVLVGEEIFGVVYRLIGERMVMRCKVTGSDCVDSNISDVLGRGIPHTARLLRVRHGSRRYQGWYDVRGKRKGLLCEC